MEDAVFFHRIEQLACGRLAELGMSQLASMRGVGGNARNAIWTSSREKALGVPPLPTHSVEAAFGTASLVLNALKEA